MDFLEKLKNTKYGKVKRKLLRKFINEYRIKDSDYLHQTLVKILDEYGGIYYDRQIYIDANFNVTPDLLASLVVKGEVDFVDTDDPVEHSGIVFRYIDKIKKFRYN